jgi:Flp pilus assembly protein TadG
VRRSSRPDRSRGATLVEAVFVTPIFFFLIFGLIEFGLTMSSISTTSSSAREGARYAAANFAVASNRTASANQIRDVVLADLNALTGFGVPVEMWVYRADSNGEPVNGAGFSSCNTDCYRYTWNTTTKNFGTTFSGPGWTTPDACLGSAGTLDSIGVYVRAIHRTVTGIFPDRTIREHVTIRFEPLPSNQCTSG